VIVELGEALDGRGQDVGLDTDPQAHTLHGLALRERRKTARRVRPGWQRSHLRDRARRWAVRLRHEAGRYRQTVHDASP
jgi:hypothetical protein